MIQMRKKILDVAISDESYELLLDFIKHAILHKQKKIIGYTNVHVLNLCYTRPDFKISLNKFDIIHPDGIGVYLASKYLYGRNGLTERVTGSDFYTILIRHAIQNSWKVFLFGDEEDILRKINIDNLNIVGKISGFNFNNEEVIIKINKVTPDILLVGLGCPLQEKWIIENYEKVNANIILAVGEGIRVFSGDKKRGPLFIQKIGLEWLVRVINNPKKYWRRYIFGNPLFVYRIIKYKFTINHKWK